MSDEPRFVDLVFEGGGVKGVGLAGAFAALGQRGYSPKRVDGCQSKPCVRLRLLLRQ